MRKVDLKKELDSYSAKRGELRLVEVPAMQYLMVDGQGDPNTSQEFQDAIEALYPVAYKLKFASKQQLDKDYVVMPLEGLWWSDDMTTFTSARDKERWSWTLMILQPDWITYEMFEEAIQKVAEMKVPANLAKVRFEKLEEGLCVQTLHIGSFDDEATVLRRIHDSYIPQNGLRMTGRHHEIYLSDFRKVEASRLKTILRQPVSRA